LLTGKMVKGKVEMSRSMLAAQADLVIAEKRVRGNGSASAQERSVTNAWQPPKSVELSFEPEALNVAETRERDGYENIIREGWNTFLEVGRALSKIRQKRLYRDHYQTFEEYCRQKWDFSKTHANRLIEAAAVADILTPIGVKVTRESHVRALVWLPPQKILAAWKKAEKLAGDGEVTASIVRQAVEEFKDDFTPNWRPAPSKTPKTLGLNRVVLHCALNLIGQAEKAARKNDTQAVLDALANLRQRLLEC
jgi:hypothetical protein